MANALESMQIGSTAILPYSLLERIQVPTHELPSNQCTLGSGAWCKCASHDHAVSRRLLSPKPMTPVEASPNFFAESYTMDAQVLRSCLVVIASFEQVALVDSRTNIYGLFHLDSSRR